MLESRLYLCKFLCCFRLFRTIDPKPCNPRTLQKPKKGGGYPKVFLGGLPSNVTETDLRTFFTRFGKVMEVVIMYDQEKKKSRGTFVVFLPLILTNERSFFFFFKKNSQALDFSHSKMKIRSIDVYLNILSI